MPVIDPIRSTLSGSAPIEVASTPGKAPVAEPCGWKTAGGLSLVGTDHRVQLHNPWDSHNQPINRSTFLVLRTHQGSLQTLTRRIVRMSSLNDTSHAMLF